MTPNTRAALLMMASMAAYTSNDAVVKLTLDQAPLYQIVVMRGVVTSVLLFLLARHLRQLGNSLTREDWTLVLLRGGFEAASTYFFLTALAYLPLADVTAAMQVLPLTVTLGAWLFFGESIGWQRMAAIALGFCGMLLIVRPGPDGFSVYALYSLCAIICLTLRELTTRKMSPRVPSLLVAFVSALMVCMLGAAWSVGTEWVPVSASLLAKILLASSFIFVGYLFSVLAMRQGDVSFSAPFRYTGLLWALVLGWLVFGEWPDAVTLTGAAIVVASGIFALYRTKVRGQPMPGQPEKTRRT